ncbi:MAG TPA: TIGR01777 family oxidoreductase [Actinocrinis sp.]|nr:TIGR01777 family oxidoreductase [Actinocrinis sp.]
MRITITGSTGLIGQALAESLLADGHDVTRLVRREPRATSDGTTEARWDPTAGTVDTAALAGSDAVVHLAGAGVGDHRWTPAYKQQIRDSRVLGTRTLATHLADLPADSRPGLFLSGSAIGYYGATGTNTVDETAPAGTDFLAEVCAAWEAAAAPAREAGIRTAHSRTGVVLSPRGGAFGRMLPLAKLGLGGPLGSGRQYWSVISLADAVAALRYVIDTPALDGPINVTQPRPVTNREVSSALGRLLHRPAFFMVPSPALHLVLGEFAGSVLYSQKVVPTRLLEAGYPFRHPTLDDTLRAALGKI